MPEIKPFSAIRYDHTRTNGDLSTLLAPPYDVLDQAEKDALLARSDRNIVAVDLPHIPPKSAGPDEAYQQAASLLGSWLDDGTMVRESSPSLYVHHQTFEHAGKSYTRRMFIARLRLAPFSERTILPHENTFGGPKEDRLALMKATRCQLSPIFGLFSDPQDVVGQAFAPTVQRSADATGSLRGVENRMWIVGDDSVCQTVVNYLVDRCVYIADGHHRYETALMYRDWFGGTQGGNVAADHPVNYIMFVLASMDDPGCLILPYNRALAGVRLATVVEAWSAGTRRTDAASADVVLCGGRSGERVALKFTAREKLKELEPDQCAPWYELDYAYLHRYLIDDLLRRGLGADPLVRYVKSKEAALTTAREEDGVAVLINATPMAHLRAVSEAGGLMPAKSTYFHPKIATGFAINPLE